MAISQAQADKDWSDTPSTSTPILSADLEAVSGMNRDRRWVTPSSVTVIDEFDDDTIGGSWVQVNGTGAASGHVTWVEDGDTLGVYHDITADTSTTVHGMVIPLSGFGGSVAAGDAFVTCMKMFGRTGISQVVSGLMLTDGTTHGAGNQVIATAAHSSTIGVMSTVTRPYTNFTTQGTVPTGMNVQAIGAELHVRLVCVSSTTWRMDVSPNGSVWMIGAVATKTITPTHVGFVVTNFAGATEIAASFDFLRRISGVS